LRLHWARPTQSKVYHQINVASLGGWPHDYRIPDLVLLRPERFAIDRNEYFEGAPSVVVEIRSPGDETDEKMPFYRDLGVPEVWIVDRDTKQVEVHVLKRKRYKPQPAGPGGWVRSPATGVELKTVKPNKLAARVAGDESTHADLPEK
jgi:Uma2 family endonuclease